MSIVKLRDKKYEDLTAVQGTVSEIINDHYSGISQLFEDPTCSDEQFKETVITLIKMANVTTKQQEILSITTKINDRFSLMDYITNVWLKGQNMGRI